MTTNGNSTTAILAYDALGRVTQSRQASGNNGPFPFSYAYNLADEVTSETYPSGRVVTITYDTAGRANGAQNQTTGAPYASGIAYAANNAIRSITFGNGLVETTTCNPRFQPTAIQAAVGAASPISLGFTYGSGLRDCIWFV